MTDTNAKPLVSDEGNSTILRSIAASIESGFVHVNDRPKCLRMIADEIDALKDELAHAKHYIAQLVRTQNEQYAELVAVTKERDAVKALLHARLDGVPWKCSYGHSIPTMAHCPDGFPGCACADDLMAWPEREKGG